MKTLYRSRRDVDELVSPLCFNHLRHSIGKRGIGKIVLSFMLTQDLTCFAIMTFVIDPAPKRELLLVSKSSLHLQDLQRHLSNPANGLDLYAGSDAQEAISTDGVTLFASSHTQGNVRASRKVICSTNPEF